MPEEDPHDDLTNCGLTAYPQIANLDPEILKELDDACRVVRFRAGQTVVHTGDTPDFVACVRTGYLRMQKSFSDGRAHIVGLLVEGDLFGRVFDAPLQFAIEAATDVEICSFRRTAFEALLLRSPELERVMMLNILNELDRARDWMIILSCQKVSGRLAGFLLILCTRFGEVDHILRQDGGYLDVFIPVSRADLAHLLGTRPESISRALHALEDAGHLRILRPDLVRIIDLDALAIEAGDEELSGRVDLKELVQSARRRV